MCNDPSFVGSLKRLGFFLQIKKRGSKISSNCTRLVTLLRFGFAGAPEVRESDR